VWAWVRSSWQLAVSDMDTKLQSWSLHSLWKLSGVSWQLVTEFFWDCLIVEDGQISHSKMSVVKHLPLPRNIPQQQIPQLHLSRSLKSCSLVCCYSTAVFVAENAVIFFLSQWGIKNNWKSVIMRFVITWKTVEASGHYSGPD